MKLSVLALIVTVLFLADLVIRYILIFRALYPIKQRPLSRQRSLTLKGSGKGSLRIALLGDSVLYGENSRYSMPAMLSVAQALAQRYKSVSVNNYAVTGDTINRLIDAQVPKAQESDLVFIYVGANDYFRFTSPRKFSRSIDRLLFELKGKTIVWCTLADPGYLYLLPIWQRYLYRYYAWEYMKYVEEVVGRHPEENWHTIDFLHEPAIRLKAQKLNSRSLIADGFHLNNAGHEMWATIVYDAYFKLKQQGAKLP